MTATIQTIQPMNPMYYTNTAESIENAARGEARVRQASQIELIDVLFAISKQSHGFGGAILRNLLRVNGEDAYTRLKKLTNIPRGAGADKLYQNMQVLNVFDRNAERVAREQRHTHIESDDVLFAVFEEGAQDPVISKLMTDLKITPKALRDESVKARSRIRSY